MDFINYLEWTNDSSNDGCITQQLRTCQTNTGDAGCCGDDYVKGKNGSGNLTPIWGISGTSGSVISGQKNRTNSEKWSGFLSRNDASSISRNCVFLHNSWIGVKALRSGLVLKTSYYSDFTNTCTDGQIWSDWGEWGDCNYVTRTKKRYRECLAGDPYCKGKLEGQEVITYNYILLAPELKNTLGMQTTGNLGRLGKLVRL